MFSKLQRKQGKAPSIIIPITLLNAGILTVFLLISSYLIYSTACFLVARLPTVQVDKQLIFNEQLALFLWVLLPLSIVIGGVLHYVITKRMFRPLRELVKFTAALKEGHFPPKISTHSYDEINQLTTTFNDLTERLKHNEDARNQMLTNMAHDLRTPLSNINGYLEAMKDGVIKGDEKLFYSLHKESERLIHMINQLQEMSKWNEISTHMMLAKDHVDIKPVIEKSLSLFELTLKNKDIPLDIELSSEKIWLNNEGIQQAITNLIQNAIQYYEGSSNIRITGGVRENMYHISITNPGAPLSNEAQASLFERFYRADSARNQKTGGTGLGLAIVKEIIVTQHNGEIGVHSHNNNHTFMISLPLSQ
ncbi:sensor histidine kinase [Alkalihalophilus sp. As8PL]|uniref:histidine kinase n=1 Tax=Alkalihalophilus sp. As8PL TaxID=3237103 RepID=A0AB39BW61_9BACI